MLPFSFRKQGGPHEASGRKQSVNSEESPASDPGLDWFHSLTSPAEGNSAFPASPIRSSTQHHAALSPSNSGPAHAEGSAWEKQAGGDSASVVRKISRKLRTKRLKEMNDGTDGVEERLNPSSPREARRKRPPKRKATSCGPPAMEQSGSENVQVDLSSFTFRPRERMTNADQASASNPAPEISEKDTGIGTGRLPQTKPKEREKTQNRCPEQPAEGSGACKKLRVRVQAEVGEIPPDESRERNETADDAQHRRQQLVHSLSSPNESDSSVQPHHPKPKVASCTLAKLSAFSFVPSPEEETSQNPTAAPIQENNSPVSRVGVAEKDGVRAEQKIPTAPAALTRQKTSRPHAKAETCEEQSASSSKRKCLQLSSARPGGLFSAFSFFGSSAVDDDALDVDWEEESRKKVS